MPEILLAEGKTKRILSSCGRNPSIVDVESKDDITAHNAKEGGDYHDIIPGKAIASTQISSDIFAYLARHNEPAAFLHRVNATRFRALNCTMIQLECVLRFKAAGSITKRDPRISRGAVFDPPLFEAYLKTSNEVIGGFRVPGDDPIITRVSGDMLHVHRANMPPDTAENPAILIPASVLGLRASYEDTIAYIKHRAHRIGSLLHPIWLHQACDLVDFKIEFGYGPDGNIYLADVIDPDAWRLITPDGRHLDKEPYRAQKPYIKDAMVVPMQKIYTEAALRSEAFRLA